MDSVRDSLKTRALGLWVATALILSAIVPALASPVCSEPPREPCGGRIFPEAETSVSFVQHDNGEYEAGIKALAEEYPRYVRVRSYSDMLDRQVRSAGDREIWMVEITDFQAPEKGKKAVVASLSVHGPERAGLEGGVRYMEDLARWATDEPERELRNGTEEDSIGIPVSEALAKVHIYMTNLNPDGWSAGDAENGGVFSRGNANGVDLNREFPTKGWTERGYTPLSEPESRAFTQIVDGLKPATATDLHGELTSANNVYADIMYPAGQWNPKEQALEERMARHMKSNVARYFQLENIPIEAGMQPAEYATAYDVVGYDDSGFMGDYFTERAGAVEMDVEHLLSHMVPNSTWVAAHEKSHIASVRGEIETLIVEAIAPKVHVSLELGKVGYLFDPKVATSKDGYGGPKPPKKVEPESYSATRMRYFKDLSRFATQPLRKVERGNLTTNALKGLDTFVIAGRPYPRDPDGERLGRRKIASRLKDFVKAGGNLVLTDKALKFLKWLGVVKRSAIAKNIHNAGHIDIENFEDDYLAGVHTTASQTYYEVPVGYSVAEDTAPHFTVERTAWEEAGGITLAYVTDEERVGLGRIELGKGTVGILGALLPNPTEKFDHFFGLADYAVTVAGGQIFNNMLGYSN